MGTVYGVRYCYDGSDITLLERNGNMAKKRGGIAGFYDRNKKVIKPVAAGLAGMLGTPALGAAVGAAFGGLDREGKRGIGIDLGGAAKGGLSGYAAGSAGSALGGKLGIGKIGGMEKAGGRLSELFTGGGKAAGATPSAATSAVKSPVGALNTPTDFADISDIGSKYVTAMPAGSPPMMPQTLLGAPPASANKYLDAAKNAGGYFERNQQMLGGVAKGVGSVLGSRAEGDAMAARTDLDRQRFEYEKQQDETEQERRRRIAELLMPMFTQMQTSYGG